MNCLSARAELQQATADIHATLHQLPAFSKLMCGGLTKQEYSALLARLYGFHYPLERVLRTVAVDAAGIDLARREKAQLLWEDLIAVGMPEIEIETLPLCKSLPELQSANDIIGCLYVVEGAGLGGHVIARNLDNLLGPECSAGRRFFLGRPDPDPLPWPAFCELLEIACGERLRGDIIRSAECTFSSFEKWLNGEARHV